MSQALRIGTRGSELALWQANFVSDLIKEKHPDLDTEIQIIKTTGDAVQSSPLAEIGGKGVFVKEIEEGLLSQQIDIAVHSMKDLPSVLPGGLCIGAVAKRHDPRDALLSKDDTTLSELPEGSKIGTGSLRRASQILHHYSGLKIAPIRGNVDTRIKKLREGDQYDAIVLAMAGIQRMGLEHEVTEILSPDEVLPAPGQGIIAIECREDDSELLNILGGINNGGTESQAAAERAFLVELEGDCNVPAGCYAELNGTSLNIRGVLSSPDGRVLIKKETNGPVVKARELGSHLAEMILNDGGHEILGQLSRS